jgi:hypothetical protein
MGDVQGQSDELQSAVEWLFGTEQSDDKVWYS